MLVPIFIGGKMAQKFEITFDASMNVGQIKSAINEIQRSLSALNLPQNLTTKFSSNIANLYKELDKFERLSSKGFENKVDFRQFETSGKKILDLFDNLRYSLSSLKNLSLKDLEKMFPPKLANNIKEARNAIIDYTRAASSQEKEVKKQQQVVENLDKAIQGLRETQSKTQNKVTVDESGYKELQKNVRSAETELTTLLKRQEELNTQSQVLESTLSAPKKSSTYRNIQNQLKELAPQIEKARAEFNELHTQLSNTTTLDKQKKELDNLSARLEELQKSLTEAQTKLSSTQSNTDAIDKLFNSLEKIDGIDISSFPKTLEGATEAVKTLVDSGITDAEAKVASFSNTVDNANTPIKDLDTNLRNSTQDFQEYDRTVGDIEALKQRITYFFGLGNAINLAHRAIQNAFDTIKELDKTMTEAAVVTDFTVSDMWSQLPEYTKRANELGIATNDAYAAATLYYQQGLETNEVIAVSNETLKMARIASIDAAEATDYMTAALRGFNMEINETSAQRINDVYSELAAITASDTQEISVAMTKVASLANNANMEFETTAALLSQIIETTRESPETAGTALKTVIARFSEVKNLFSEGALLGTDEEGQEIDVNKISTALRTAGINLNEYLTGMKGLDDIFLELAEKWDSLSTIQQRYIATQAAGSRQQSRFIAMMGNHDRTMELVSAANNSAGASQEQFNKTLESMETKLARLANAWNEFTMNLANNEVLKAVVDLLTNVLNAINKTTEALSGGNGLAKSILNLGVVFGGLKLGKTVFNKIFSQITGVSKSEGANSALEWLKSFRQGLTSKSVRLSDVSKDIVNNINKGIKNGLQATPKMLASVFQNAGAEATQQFLVDVPNLQQNITNAFNNATADLDGISKLSAQNLIKNFNINFAEQPIESLNHLQNKYIELQNSVAAQGIKLPPLDISQAITNLNTLEQKMSKVGVAVGVAAGAFNGIITLLEETGAISEESSDKLQSFGTSIMGLGAAIVAVMQMIQLMGGVVTAVIAAIGALILLVISIKNSIDKNSLEGRMKAAAEAAEAAKEAAEDARSAYDDLLSNKSNYDELQQSLADLVKGTDEWKQKLVEVNQQVLDLLTSYPVLAQYLERGAEGQLVIQEEGWDKVIESQFEGIQNASASALSAQIDEELLRQEKVTRDMQERLASKNASWTGSEWIGLQEGEAVAWQTDSDRGIPYEEATLNALYDAFKTAPEELFATSIDEDGLIQYSDTLNEIASESNYTAEDLWNLKNALAEYDAAINQSEITISGQAEGILSALASEDFIGANYSEELISAFSRQIANPEYQQEVESRSLEIYQRDSAAEASKDEGRFVKLAKEYDVYSDTVLDDLEDLRTLYKAMAGVSTIPDAIKDNKEALAKEIADMDMTREIADSMERFRSNMEKLTDEEQRQFSSLISGQATQLTYGELTKGTPLQSYATGMGYDDVNQLAGSLGYESGSDLIAFIEEARANAVKEYNSYLDKWSQETQEELANYSLETVKNLSDQISNMSEGSAEAYIKNFGKVLESANLGEEAKDSLESALSKTDWSNITDALNTVDYMRELEIDQSIIDNFWAVAITGANTYIDSLEEASSLTEYFQNQLSSASDISERFISGEGTSEDIVSLSNAGVDTNALMQSGDLQLSTEGWQMTEDAAEKAGKAIKEAISDDAIKAFNQQLQKLQGNFLNIAGYNIKFSDILGLDEEDGIYSYTRDLDALSEAEKRAVANLFNIDITDGDYWTEAKTKLDEYLASLNMLQATKALAVSQTYTAEQAEAVGADEQTIAYAAEGEAMSAGVEYSTLQAMEQQLIRINELTRGQAAQVAAYNAIMNIGLGEIIGSYNEWTALIDKNTGLIKASSAEDVAAYDKLRKSVNQMLNTSEDLSEAFWDNAENIELVKEAAEGDMDALGELQKIAASDYILQISAETDDTEVVNALDDLSNLILNTELPTLEPGMDLSDVWNGTDEFIAACNNLIAQSGMTREQVSEAFRALGYDVEYDENPQTVMQKMAVPKTTYTIDYDENGQVRSINPHVEIEEYPYEATVAAPTIRTLTSVGSGGGGISTGNRSSAASNRPSSSRGGGGGGSGGSTKKEEPWENPYDWLYNLTEKINKKLREREKIERRYNKLIESRRVTSAQLLANAVSELNNLKAQSVLQNEMLARRKEEMQDEMNEYSSLLKYGSYNFDTGLIQINWDLIDSVTDTDEGEKIEEYISKLEEIRDEIWEAGDSLNYIQDQIDEINERGKDEYTSLEERIKDAIINSRQEEIDRLSAINDSINDTNSKLIDSIQQTIDQQRQDRENQQTEEDIADQQRRLVYLQQDTSGANALEILQLQDEITKSQESYTDQLIDQKISELQQQNDAAAEQRERQIDILQSQLDYDQKFGTIASQTTQAIKDLMEGGSGGVIINGTSLAELLMANEDFASLTGFAKAEWWADLQTEAALATLYYKEQLASYSKRNFAAEIMEAIKNGDYDLAAELEQIRNYKIDLLDMDYEKTYSYATGDWTQWENQVNKPAQKNPTPVQSSDTTSTPPISDSDKKKVAAAIWRGGLGWGSGAERTNKLIEVFGENNGVQDMVNRGVGKNDSGSDLSNYSYEKMRKKYKGYKTGGKVDYTGPAWLDGTPSRPEIVLNQEQSQNFIQLRDILSSLMSSKFQRDSESNGDNYFDIDITVESLTSSYDTQALANDVKRMIYEDGQYRNVNVINNLK